MFSENAYLCSANPKALQVRNVLLLSERPGWVFITMIQVQSLDRWGKFLGIYGLTNREEYTVLIYSLLGRISPVYYHGTEGEEISQSMDMMQT